MHVKILDLPEIAVIGKEGLCTEERNVVQELWQEANTHFSEVAALGKKTASGAYAGFWGAMSDENRTFQPWTLHFSRGLYLAGVETDAAAAAPNGWTKWIMPARKYLVADVVPEQYGQVFQEVISITIPELGMKLAGAVCDYTDPATGCNMLYFPIEAK